MELGTSSDWTNWDYWKEQVNQGEELSEFEKQKVVNALDILCGEVGEAFLQYAFANHHPLINYLVNMAPWTRRWLRWFGEAIQQIGHCPSSKHLLHKLGDAQGFATAFNEFWTATKLMRAGFGIEFYPKVSIRARQKIPDLKIVNEKTSETFFVEVAGIKESIQAREASETFNAISTVLFRHISEVEPIGRIYKPLSKPHLEEIIAMLEKLVEETKLTGEMKQLVEEGTLEIALAPRGNREPLAIWAKERGIETGSLSGPSWDVDEVMRAKRKIEDEQTQLPLDTLNVLVIRSPELFMGNRDMKRVIGILEESIYSYDYIVACILFTEYLSSPAKGESLIKGQHIYVKKQGVADLLTEEILILINRFANKGSITPSSFAGLIRAFTS